MNGSRSKIGAARSTVFFTAWLAAFSLPAATVVLQLQNGDRLTGELQREDAQQVVLMTSWAQTVAVPLTEIRQRSQPVTPANPTAAPQSTAPTKPAVALIATPPPAKKPARNWKGDAQVGLNFAYGIREYESYYGRLRAMHSRSYERDAHQSWRNSFEYSAEYGESHGRTFQNRMDGGLESAADFSPRYFGYGLVSTGYDEIRKIDLRYELGPGLGWHMFQRTNFTANAEVGVNYQSEERTREQATEEFFYRLVQDMQWRINSRLSFEEKFEYLPGMDSFRRTRAMFEATLRIKLLENLSLNLTVQNLHDTKPVADVEPNELKIRSSLGVTF